MTLNWEQIVRPTLVVDEQRVWENIKRMAARAQAADVRFRPHFKTHQSKEIGVFFRAAGVTSITVSSLAMAEYFAAQGWNDITVAFSFNLREAALAAELAQKIHLGVLIESEAGAAALAQLAPHRLDAWIKVDSGAGRTGIIWQDMAHIARVARIAQAQPHVRLRGLLTHAGHTYKAASPEEIPAIYTQSWQRLAGLCQQMQPEFGSLEISVGDTPGCMLSPNLGAVNEIRPGNFVFYDGQMLNLGVCTSDQIAAVLACPVVALHPERGEAVIYGGAIHLSKDTLVDHGHTWYGYVVPLQHYGWGAPLADAGVVRLSQEHGILQLPAETLNQLHVGDLIGVIPAHICLTVAALQRYITLDGRKIITCPPDLG